MVCECVWCTAVDSHPNEVVLPPCNQCFWDKLWTDPDPDQDTLLPENEWRNEGIISLENALSHIYSRLNYATNISTLIPISSCPLVVISRQHLYESTEESDNTHRQKSIKHTKAKFTYKREKKFNLQLLTSEGCLTLQWIAPPFSVLPVKSLEETKNPLVSYESLEEPLFYFAPLFRTLIEKVSSIHRLLFKKKKKKKEVCIGLN